MRFFLMCLPLLFSIRMVVAQDKEQDVSNYPDFVAELLRRGHSKAVVEGIPGGNLMCVWKTVEGHASDH